MDLKAFIDALTFDAGYNTAIVALGAIFLGWAGGTVGTFLLLRRRSLVSDALSHATLPGVGLAFLVMAFFGGTGRFLPGLLLGAALSALAGLAVVEWLTRRTRLQPDAAIGAVLSAFFGLGVVILTVVQSAQIGQQAGIGSFLLGSTSGMLRSEAMTLTALAVGCAAAVLVMRRRFTLVAFDETFASATGISIRRTDLILMLLVLAVTVTGLRVVGLVLVIALLIIPPVAARFWTDRVERMMLISGFFGAASGFLGTALSASIPDLPTGPIIVLVSFVFFLFSMLCAPVRGVVSAVLRATGLARRLRLRQGLLVLATTGRAPADRRTRRLLAQNGLTEEDGRPTLAGREAASAALREDKLWQLFLEDHPDSRHRAGGILLEPLSRRLGKAEIAALADRLWGASGKRPEAL